MIECNRLCVKHSRMKQSCRSHLSIHEMMTWVFRWDGHIYFCYDGIRAVIDRVILMY